MLDKRVHLVYNINIPSTNSAQTNGGDYMPYNEQLKKLRGEISQEEIAKKIGITKSSWSMYERGERVPRDEIKIRIANFFGKSVQEIFFGQQ